MEDGTIGFFWESEKNEKIYEDDYDVDDDGESTTGNYLCVSWLWKVQGFLSTHLSSSNSLTKMKKPAKIYIAH